MAAGHSHAAAVTVDGKLFMWGMKVKRTEGCRAGELTVYPHVAVTMPSPTRCDPPLPRCLHFHASFVKCTVLLAEFVGGMCSLSAASRVRLPLLFPAVLDRSTSSASIRHVNF